MNEHLRAETIAGAIALGEAGEDERNFYRAHIAECASCRHELGGEVAIAHVVETVALARDAETWRPAIDTPALARRARRRTGRTVAAGMAAVVAAALTAFALRGNALAPPPPQHVAMNVFRVTVEPAAKPVTGAHHVAHHPAKARRPAKPSVHPPVHSSHVARVAPSIVIEHHVVQLARIAQTPAPAAARATRVRIRRKHAAAFVPARVPVWRTVAKTTTTTATSETAVEPISMTAASMQIAPPVIHEPEPIGGENVISPRPPAIAYVEGMEGTTLFDVAISPRGLPTRCSIVASSGYHTLDESVCRAAMVVRYTPETINGRPAPGDFRDAFTFRISNTSP